MDKGCSVPLNPYRKLLPNKCPKQMGLTMTSLIQPGVGVEVEPILIFKQPLLHMELSIQSDVMDNDIESKAPRFMTILAYFWPLFASTTVFLVAIIAFGGVSKFSTEGHGHGEKAGEGLLDYVTGMSEHTEEARNF
ncbi:hypothetical protein E2542_SST18337 [Spatholobus suberectus]|nr:hypothetical protein E2542_SST18337 [Spatholobus suberectus]